MRNAILNQTTATLALAFRDNLTSLEKLTAPVQQVKTCRTNIEQIKSFLRVCSDLLKTNKYKKPKIRFLICRSNSSPNKLIKLKLSSIFSICKLNSKSEKISRESQLTFLIYCLPIQKLAIEIKTPGVFFLSYLKYSSVHLEKAGIFFAAPLKSTGSPGSAYCSKKS